MPDDCPDHADTWPGDAPTPPAAVTLPSPAMPDWTPAATPADPYEDDAPPFVPAKHFTPGRPLPVELVVIHTTENACKPGVARAVAAMFHSPPPGAKPASAHYVLDPEETIQCVREEDEADGAPGANATGVHLEHSARAAFTAEQWAEPGPVAMLQRSARLTAAICARHGVPVEYVDAAGLRAGKRGITGHVEVSRAFKRSDHFDPGVAFPWAAYLAMVRAAMTA